MRFNFDFCHPLGTWHSFRAELENVAHSHPNNNQQQQQQQSLIRSSDSLKPAPLFQPMHTNNNHYQQQQCQQLQNNQFQANNNNQLQQPLFSSVLVSSMPMSNNLSASSGMQSRSVSMSGLSSSTGSSAASLAGNGLGGRKSSLFDTDMFSGGGGVTKFRWSDLPQLHIVRLCNIPVYHSVSIINFDY